MSLPNTCAYHVIQGLILSNLFCHDSYFSTSFGRCGLGPINDIVPHKTQNNCGNSSREVFLKNLPFISFSKDEIELFDIENSNEPYYIYRSYDTGMVFWSEENFISKENLLNLIEEQFKYHTWDKFVIFDVEQNKTVEPIFSI